MIRNLTMSNSVKLFLIAVLLIGGLWGENIRELVKDNIDVIDVSDHVSNFRPHHR